MNRKKSALALFTEWFDSLSTHKSVGGPARGTMAAALNVLERLKDDYNLSLDSHRAAGGSQIKGASGASLTKILQRFGETRPFLKEGGRTNRGAPGDIGEMLAFLKEADLKSLDHKKRVEILEDLQAFLVNKVREYHNRQRIRIEYDPAKTTWQTIRHLLTVAKESGKEGPVAQHLVGAKLELRFPRTPIRKDSYSTADDQQDWPGDFLLGDTVFHVTVAPMPQVYDKCKRNIEEGLRVYLLVPSSRLTADRQNADDNLPGRIAVESIESFVAQNLEEMSDFSKKRLISGFRRLLETYNRRVDEAETDKSMMIDIPRNLR